MAFSDGFLTLAGSSSFSLVVDVLPGQARRRRRHLRRTLTSSHEPHHVALLAGLLGQVVLKTRSTRRCAPSSCRRPDAEDVARRAKDTSRELEGRRAALDGRRSRSSLRRSGFIPRVSGGIAYTRLSDITAGILGLGDEGRFLVTTGPAGRWATAHLRRRRHQLPGVPGQLRAAPDGGADLRTTCCAPCSRCQRRAVEGGARVGRAGGANSRRQRRRRWRTSPGCARAGSRWVARQTLEQSRSRAEDIKRAFDVGSGSGPTCCAPSRWWSRPPAAGPH